MTIANRLNEAMSEGDGHEEISQSELFRRSGVPQPTIARILKGDGKRGPETETLIALAKALGVEFMWLQQGVEPKFKGGAATPPAPKPAPSPEHPSWMDPQAFELLQMFSALNERKRKDVVRYVQGLRGAQQPGSATKSES